MTDDIVTFIKVRLHEDQTAALDALKDWPPGDEIAGQVDSILVGAHVHRQSPQRTLRGIEAKRRIVDDLLPDLEHADRLINGEWNSNDDCAGRLLRLLASEWDTHPDFRPEWTS